MKILRVIRTLTVSFALIGLVFPLSTTVAAGPQRTSAMHSQAPGKDRVLDISLGAGGRLEGIITDGTGKPLSQPVLLAQPDGKLAAKGASTRDGRFSFDGLRGGVYQLVTQDAAVVCRLWSANAAPPAASKGVLLVSDPTVTRGQRPIGELLFSPSAIIGAIIVAAIVIPIAVHNSQDDAS